jgi:O-methyltransferase
MKLFQAFNYLIGGIFNRRNAFINYSLLYTSRKRVIDRNYMDYIRLSTLELIADEINHKDLKGAVAELGVYKGKFARYINLYFPDRKLYLFDTFKGFSEKDKTSEMKNNFSDAKQDFSNTSVNSVLSIMPYAERCIIKEGYFPETAIGLHEEFVFVSIDADLFEPIYEGLKYFYPRLQKGGYLFVHDYNNDEYKGAREAVRRFCLENELPFLPLPDSAGSAVLMK